MRVKALTIVAVALILATSAWAAVSESVLYSFLTQSGDGYYPYASLISDKSGNLYGTTYYGGANSYYGAVFELSPSGSGWNETVLYSFTGKPDGQAPYGSLVFDKAGNLYGTTYYGGVSNYGTVFELKHSGSSWKESVLYSFTGTNGDGAYPLAGLVFDAKGNLYGTTYAGGKGYGTAFELKPSKSGKWTVATSYSFLAGTDGAYPQYGALIAGKGGYFYGTTLSGGGTYNVGTVYELFLARGVLVEKPIFSFSGGNAGTYPYAGVALDAKGNLYGTTYQGGSANSGIAYRLNKSKKWSESVLHSFTGGTDGAYLYSAVALDAKDNVYGTTYQGGTSSVGTVFKLTLTNGKYKESVLYSFKNSGGDGLYPRAGVILDSKGNLYGTTLYGGIKNGGSVFEVTP